MRTYARARIFEAGDVMRVNIFPVRAIAKGRGAKRNPSRACQVALNLRNSRNRFTDIAHLNFNAKEGGLRVSLDYNIFISQFGRNPGAEEYKAYLAAYFRKVKALYASYGLEFKYMAVTHVGRRSGKVHHHCIIPSLPLDGSRDLLQSLWLCGYANFDPLRFSNGSISGLTSYFFDGTVDQKWSCSRNCKRPSKVDYPDGTPASVTYSDRAVTMSEAYYIDKNREDIAYIEKLFPGYAVSFVRQKSELIGVSGTVYDILPFDGPFIEIQLYKLSAADKRIKLKTPRGRVKPRLKV